MSRPRKQEPAFYSRGKPVEWILSDWFCPACGKRDMWQDCRGGGDYYHDYDVTCGSCGYKMCCVELVKDKPEPKAPWWDAVSVANLK